MEVETSTWHSRRGEQASLARWSGRAATGLFVLAMTGSGLMYLLGPPNVTAVFHHLGYPLYFSKLLGVAKLLGILGILGGGRYPPLREWAYAGFTFDLLAAALSHAIVGDGFAAAAPLVALALLAASYFLWRAPRTGESPATKATLPS
jgi:hypothetical protein